MDADLSAFDGSRDGLAVGGEGFLRRMELVEIVGQVGIPADILNLADQLRLNPGGVCD